MSKFTKGPWIVTYGIGGYDTVISTQIDHTGGHAIALTCMRDGRLMPETEANAHLIAAAPLGDELAELVVSIDEMRLLISSQFYVPTWEDWNTVVRLAREFKAAAEGRDV